MKKLVIAGMNVTYFETGDPEKTPLVLIHGWGQSYSFWEEICRRYESTYHIYALDLPGFGMSEEPDRNWSIQDYSQFLAGFLSKENIIQPVIIGHSFGGRIAIHYCSNHSVKKLILYSTGGGLPEKSLLKNLNRLIFARFGALLFPVFFYTFYSEHFKPKSYKNNMYVNVKRARRMLQIYCQPLFNLEKNLKKITAPTLVIVGENDNITDPALGSEIAMRIPKARLVRIKKATHFSHIEYPTETFAEMDKFLLR